MEKELTRYTIRIDKIYFKKFRYIAASKGRSANKEIEYYIKKCVNHYIAINGPINISDEKISKV